jgi:heme exporter protein A
VNDCLLTITNLRCVREGRLLFSGLNLALAAGEYLELTGPNGSGKSTLLRCATGLFHDYEGRIEREPFLYLGHKPGVSPLLSPREQLRWFQCMTETDGDPLAALARVDLGGYEDLPCQQLSAGQQRRVALARLVLAKRRLWLLDEPLTALDGAGQALVQTLIGSHLATGGAVLCATHQPLPLPAKRTLGLGEASAA